ncbi:hypothetical protein E1A91_A04G145000v1 [Gossypium mustelinum]|uniref:Uncharacterized protein n=1 Tax=Gossypium mustelinum TaxID=34275 RepID=A0A5D2ZNK8_GOSMU|nr:hypothetical protein E1A91_A04G145000v1 [Gossypium mustelinum]
MQERGEERRNNEERKIREKIERKEYGFGYGEKKI